MERVCDRLKEWLLVILDHIDYTNNACAPNEMVGAVLPVDVIKQTRIALKDYDNAGRKV